MRECPDRLAADLRRFYGVRLSDMYAGNEDVLEVAHMAAHMPSGGAVGEWYGGAIAVSAEVLALWELSHIVAQVNSEKKVKPRAMPEGVRDAEHKRAKALDKAARYKLERERRVTE